MSDRYWIELRGERRLLGLTPESAERMLGDWIGLELAQAGTRIASGDSFGMVTTDQASHDLRAERAMKIVVVNAKALTDPRVVRL